MFEIVGQVTNTIGGSDTWVVAIVAGCAAILASLVTGGIVTRNNQNTIGAERERLTQTLEAEDRRLERRLSFERAERDRSGLIEVLESIAKNLEGLSHVAMDGIDAANTIYAAFRLHEGVDWEPVQELSNRRDHLEMSAMDSLIRLSLMLGDESETLVAQVLKSTNASREVLEAVLGDPEQFFPAIGEASDQVEAARREFFKLARSFTAIRLHEPMSPAIDPSSHPPHESDY
jgi:hypothetical protein